MSRTGASFGPAAQVGHAHRSRATSSASSGKRGPVWYAKYRLPDGRQVQKHDRAGVDASAAARRPATSRSAPRRRGCATCSTRRARGTLPGHGPHRRDVRRRRDEWLRYVEHDRARKPSTMRDYRSIVRAHLAAGVRRRCGSRTSRADASRRWRATLTAGNRTKNKMLTMLNGIFERARQRATAAAQPGGRRREAALRDAARRSRSSRPRRSGRSSAPPSPSRTPRSTSPPRSPACAAASCRAALARRRLRRLSASASRARYAGGRLTTPKSGKVRSVPMAPEVAAALARLGRPRAAGPATTTSSSPATPAATSTARRCAAATSARSSAPACGRCASTTCATRSARAMIAKADIRRVQEWMGHADVADDDALPALRPAPRRRRARRRGVRRRAAHAGRPCLARRRVAAPFRGVPRT